jgi:hypothetical protein
MEFSLVLIEKASFGQFYQTGLYEHSISSVCKLITVLWLLNYCYNHPTSLRDSSAFCLWLCMCSLVEFMQRMPRLLSRYGFYPQEILVALPAGTGVILRQLGTLNF